jgi:hypothetical protein
MGTVKLISILLCIGINILGMMMDGYILMVEESLCWLNDQDKLIPWNENCVYGIGTQHDLPRTNLPDDDVVPAMNYGGRLKCKRLEVISVNPWCCHPAVR